VAENNARLYENRYNEVNGKYNQSLADRKKFEDQAKELALENERLRRQLDDLRKQLEAETLARVDLENQNQSLREELAFKDQVHTQELTETRSRRQIEISEIDGRLSRQYEAKLQQSLQELRDQYEGQMRINREEIELLYDNEIQNLKAAANRAAQGSALATEEVRLMRTKIDGLNAKLQNLEDTNAGLNVSTAIATLNSPCDFNIDIFSFAIGSHSGAGEPLGHGAPAPQPVHRLLGSRTTAYARRDGSPAAGVPGSDGHQGVVGSRNCRLRQTAVR